MNDYDYAIWIANIDYSIGNAHISKLLNVYKCFEDIFKASEKSLINTNILNEKQILMMIESKNMKKYNLTREIMDKDNINFTYLQDIRYPKKLRHIQNPPFCLYYKGELPDDNKKSIAVIGARNANHEGRELSEKYSKQIAEYGIEVISGLAYGIDICAHRGALSVTGGKTFACLGCSVDICYPRSNINEYIELINNGGIISEFPPKTPPIARNFPMRNRIISGLSDGVLVIEAGKNSGSLITASMALDQGRELMVIPGNIRDRLYFGSNELIKGGACLVTEVKDILDCLGIFYDNDIEEEKTKIYKDLNSTEKEVIGLLNLNPCPLEYILEKTMLPLPKIMKILIKMEIKGYIRDIGNHNYAIRL